jgi:hypothetical protein
MQGFARKDLVRLCIGEERMALARDGPPKLTPPAKLAGTPISDDEIVAKMGTRLGWLSAVYLSSSS